MVVAMKRAREPPIQNASGECISGGFESAFYRASKGYIFREKEN